MGFAGEAREELGDFFLAHLRGMTLVVEEDKPFDPVDVGFLGSRTIVPYADRLPDLFEQLGLLHWRKTDRGNMPDAITWNIAGWGKWFCSGIRHSRLP